MPCADAAFVLAELHVPRPVQTVLDAPMAAPPGQKLSGVCLCAGDTADGVGHLDCAMPFAPGRAFQAADLGQARPQAATSQARRGLQAAPFNSAVRLVEAVSLIQISLSLLLSRRGKKPAEIQPQSLASAQADCL